jgi:hypothetical protein
MEGGKMGKIGNIRVLIGLFYRPTSKKKRVRVMNRRRRESVDFALILRMSIPLLSPSTSSLIF